MGAEHGARLELVVCGAELEGVGGVGSRGQICDAFVEIHLVLEGWLLLGVGVVWYHASGIHYHASGIR